MRTLLTHDPLRVDAVIASVSQGEAGAIDVFLGVVRNHAEGRPVSRLEYSAYASMAVKELQRIQERVEACFPAARCAIHHRLGLLHVGDLAVVCAASTPHRQESFDACRMLIEEVKRSVPMWKRESGPDGTAWVGWVDARCGLLGHAHAHSGHRESGCGDPVVETALPTSRPVG